MSPRFYSCVVLIGLIIGFFYTPIVFSQTLSVTHSGPASMTRNDANGETFTITIRNTAGAATDSLWVVNNLPDSLLFDSTPAPTATRNGSGITLSYSNPSPDSLIFFNFSNDVLAPGDSIVITYDLLTTCNLPSSIVSSVTAFGSPAGTDTDTHNISISTSNGDLGKFVINEASVTGAAANEWVELYVVTGDNINGWTISNQNGNTYTFPDQIVGAGEYVVFHAGSGTDDFVGPVYHFYAGGGEFFTDAGDDILLTTDLGNDVDYIAYGTGGNVNAPPCDMPWVNDIDITGLVAGNSIALAPNGTDTNNGTDWVIRTGGDVSPGVTNDPALQIELFVAELQHDRNDTAGDWYSIRITNIGGSALEDFTVINVFDSGFDYKSTSQIINGGLTLSSPGDFVTTVFSPDSVRWQFNAAQRLAVGDTLRIDHYMQTDCTVLSATYINPVQIRGEDDQNNPISASTTFTHDVVIGNLVLEVVAIEKNGTPITPSSSVIGSFEDTIRVEVRLKNTGEGRLFNVTDSTTWFADFVYVAGSFLGSGNVTPNIPSRYFTALFPVIEAGYDSTYSFEVYVNGCDSLSVPSTAGEPCTAGSQTVSTGLTFLLKQPNVNITFPGTVNVESGYPETVSLPVTNTNGGRALNFVIQSDLNASTLTVENVASDWSYNAGNGDFTYTGNGGTLFGDSTTTLSFDVRQADLCADTTFSFYVSWEPVYESVCQDTFFTPVGLSQFNSTSRLAVLTVTNTQASPAGSITQGDTVLYDITVNISDTTKVTGNTITVVDTLPSQFTITDTTYFVGNVSVSSNVVTWTVLAEAAADSSPTLRITTDFISEYDGACTTLPNLSHTAYGSVDNDFACTLTDQATVTSPINPRTDALTLVKTPVPNTVNARDTLSFTYVVGIDDSTYIPVGNTVTITDTLPVQFTIDSLSATAGTPGNTGNAITWTMTAAQADAGQTLTVHVTLSTPYDGSCNFQTTLNSTANGTVNDENGCPITATDDGLVNVNPLSTVLTITKTAFDSTNVAPLDTLQFNLTVSLTDTVYIAGTDSVVVTDTLSGHWTLRNTTYSIGQVTIDTTLTNNRTAIQWRIHADSVRVADRTLSYFAELTDPYNGTCQAKPDNGGPFLPDIINTAYARLTDDFGCPMEDTDTETTVIDFPRAVDVAKSANWPGSPGNLAEGDTVTFSLNINVMDTTYVDTSNVVTVTDVLHSSLTFLGTNDSVVVGTVDTTGLPTLTWTLSAGQATTNPTLQIYARFETVDTDPCTPITSFDNDADIRVVNDFSCTENYVGGNSDNGNTNAGGRITIPVQDTPALFDTSATISKTIGGGASYTLTECDGQQTVTVVNTYNFGKDFVGSWTNSTFLATTTHPNMQYAGNLTYTLTDSNSTVFGPNPIPVADSTVSNDSIYITLDFLFDEADDFVRGDQLIIQYDLSFDPPNIGPDSTLTYPTTSTLSINGNNAGCGGGGNGDYVQTVNFVQSNPGITLALSQAAAVFDTFDVDIDLNITNYTADSVFVTLIHPDYVFVDTNSVSGFGNIKPTIITLGDSTRFSFAGSSLPVGTGTIQAKIYNDCTPTTSINARVDYNCTDPAFATDNLSFTIPTPNITITPNFSRNIVADCDTISVDIDLVGVSGSNWNADTVEVVIETTNYLYNSVTSITGFGGVLPSDTTAYADSLVFRFLNTPNTSATGTIRLLLTKICGTPKLLNVALHERDACGTVYGSVTNSDEPLLNTVADVSVIFTPNDVTVENINPSWIIYVTNSGSGTAFNTALYDSIGQHLRLDSVYVNGSRQDSLITFNYQVNKTTFDIDLGDLAPGQTDTITVFTRLKGTDCDLADQTSSTTTWYKNCPGSCATPIVKDGVPRFTVPNSNLRARNVVPDSVELCSTDTLAIYLINNGATTDYNIEAEYDFLQTGFEYQTGTTKVQLNSGARTATNDPAGFTAGDTLLLWTKTEIPELASLDVGDTLKIFFEVRTTCDFSANRRTSTVARYSTPCQVDTSGTSTATEISLSNSITIEIKEPIITLNKDVAKDTTGSWSNTIYASYNEPVYYRIQIYNNGNATAQNALIRDSIPSNLQYQTIVPQGSAPAISSVNIVNGAYEFTLASDLPLGLSEYYIYTVVDSCVDPVTNLAYVYWGCNASSCRDLFTSVTSGTVVTQPSVAGATSVVSSADFSTCGGEMRIIVDNDTTGGMPSSVARNVVVTDTLPTGYVYDQGTATITSTYISTGLPTGRTFADTEPDTSAGGTIIQWATEVDTIIPGERITITFRVEGDGTYCDSDLNSDPGIVPTSDNVVDLDYTNTCGDPIVSPPATTTVNPLTPNVNIDITPTLQTAGLGQRVTFTVTLTNVGDGAADSLYLNIELGNGFSSIVQESGQGGGVDSLGVATIIGDSVLYWDYTDIDTIEAAGGNDTKSAVFSAIVGPDSLNVLGVVEGWCVDGAGTRICRHSYDTTPAIVTVAGVEFNKVHWSTVQPGAVTSDSTAYGTIGNPIFHRDSLNLFAAGNYTGVTIGDSISTGMEYVPGSFSIITNTTGSTVTLSDSTAPSLVWTVADFVSPGGQGEVVIQYATRPQDVPGNDYTIPTQLPNTGYTDFSIYGVNYNHNAFPATMSRTIDYYIVEPNVSTFSKTSNISGTINGDSTIVFTLRAVNSGTSPAYQITIADTLPYGMRNATPTINTVEIRPDAGSTRDLVVLGVIDTTYTAATGILTFKTQGDSTQGGLAPLDTLFIQYTVDVDDTISANGIATAGQTLVTLSNYADITGYTSMPDTSANERTYDPNLLQSISFQTPNVTLSRSFTRQQSTTYDGGSNRPHITIGEYTTITYEITVPAYTQAYNPNALIQLDDGWEIQEITINGGDNPNIFNYIRTGTYRGFEVQWDRIRAGASDSLVTITVIASVMSNYHGGGSGQNEAGPLNGVVDVSDELRVRTQNRGVNDFNWDTYDENGNPTTQDEDYGPNIRYYVIEPQIISFTKTHTTPDDTVQANENIPFTLTFDNNYPGYNFDSPAYDVVVVDTLPIGMRLTDPSGTVAITSSTDGAFTSGTDFNASFNSGTGVLTIAFDTTATAVVDPNEVITITYTATVDSSIGAGVTMQNCAAVLSYTSIKDTAQYGNFTGPADSAYVTPERVYTQVGPDCNTFYTRGPTSSKSVTTQYHAPADGDSVQIGEEIYYQIQFIVPDSATAYDVVFRDTIPDGLTVLNTSTTHGTITETPQGNGTTLVQVSGAEFDSLFGGAAGLTVTIDITARVDSTFNGGSPVDSTDSFSNTGYFTWNYINDDVGTQLSSVTNTVTTYVNEPEFANFVKTQTTGNPVSGTQIVNYTVTFDNVGDGVAYETVFRDTVPQGMRDTDPTTLSISITVGARTLGAGDTTLLYDGTVFTIEFDSTANTPVYPGETVTINYQLQVDASIGTSAYMVNHAVVDTFSSLPGSTPFERVYQSTQNDTALAFTDGLPTQIKNQYSVFVDPTPTDSTDVVTTIGDTLYYIIEFDVPNQTTAYQSVFLDTLPDGVSLVDLRFQNNSGSIDTLYTGLGDTIALSLGSLPGNATVNPYRITMRTNVDQQYFGGSPDVARDSVLTNRAGFRWNTINGNPASVTQIQSNPVQATIIEPTISNLVKNLDVPPVAPNLGTDGNGNPIVRPGVSSVNYTVTFQNTGNSAAYDVVIRDTIPAEMNGTEPTITTFTSGGRALTDGVDYSRSYTAATGEWIITLITNASNATARVDTAETVLLEYTATLDSEIMESSKLITNRVDVIDYSTLPGNLPLERDTDSTPAYADVGPDSAGVVAIEGATITKTPTGTTWRIGDRQSYTLTVELPRQTVIYYPVVIDTLPEATRMDTTTVSYGRSDASITDPNTALTSFDISDSLNSFRRFIPRWEFNPITNANTSPESIYVYYTVDVTGKNSTGQNLFLNTSVDGTVTNNASVNWNYVNHGFSDDLAADYESRYASTSHTIVQPRMSITKTADKQTVAAGDTVRYRIEVVNSGSSPAKAYDIIITDVVPNGMRSDNPLTGSPAPAYEINNVATTPSLAVYDSTTGRITWTFGSGDSLNSGGDSLVIYYSAIVDSNILDIVPLGTAFTNTAQVDTWYSHPTSTYRRKYSPGPDASATVHLGGIIILPDQSRTVPKGTRVHYFHDVTNLGSVPDDVNLSFTSSRGWAWAIYLDDGSGNPTGSPITSLSNVPAGGTVDIIVTAFVPTSTPDNAVDVTVFTATSVNNPAITSSVTDMTTVGDVQTGSMQLVKSVDKAVASPGDTLLYTVTYINAGADTLLQIDLSDPISEFVNIVYDGFDTGAGSQDIEFVRPDGSTIYLTADANDGDNDGGGYDGHSISIDFTNVNVNVLELTPGQSGQMSYKVTIK